MPGPLVVNLGIPQFVPGFFVIDFRVKKKLKIILEGGDLRDPGLFDFPDKLRPDIIMVFLVLVESSGLEPQGKGPADDLGFLLSRGGFHFQFVYLKFFSLLPEHFAFLAIAG